MRIINEIFGAKGLKDRPPLNAVRKMWQLKKTRINRYYKDNQRLAEKKIGNGTDIPQLHPSLHLYQAQSALQIEPSTLMSFHQWDRPRS